MTDFKELFGVKYNGKLILFIEGSKTIPAYCDILEEGKDFNSLQDLLNRGFKTVDELCLAYLDHYIVDDVENDDDFDKCEEAMQSAYKDSGIHYIGVPNPDMLVTVDPFNAINGHDMLDNCSPGYLLDDLLVIFNNGEIE